MKIEEEEDENTKDKSGIAKEGLQPYEIFVIVCPHCGKASYYGGGFTASCFCCGFYNLADFSDDAISLADYWAGDAYDYDLARRR